jgi:hypothetical protein
MCSGRKTRWIVVVFALSAILSRASSQDRKADPARIVHIDPLPLILKGAKSTQQQIIVVETKGGVPNVPQRLVLRVGAVKTELPLNRPKSDETTQTLVRAPYGPGAKEKRSFYCCPMGASRIARNYSWAGYRISLLDSFLLLICASRMRTRCHSRTTTPPLQSGKPYALLEKYPEAVWSVEFTCALNLYWDRHPEQHQLIRRMVRDGRLEVGGRFTPNHQDGLDGESLAVAPTDDAGVEAGVTRRRGD